MAADSTPYDIRVKLAPNNDPQIDRSSSPPASKAIFYDLFKMETPSCLFLAENPAVIPQVY